MKTSGVQEVDFIVIGCGVAGLRAAIELAPAGKVLVLAKSNPSDAAAACASRATTAALSDEEEVGLHYQETINAGDGLCHVEAVKVLVKEGPACLEQLIDWSAALDRNGGKLTFAREGPRKRSRVLHAHGVSATREVHRILFAKAKSLANISIVPDAFTTDLLQDERRVAGLRYLDTKLGTHHEVRASAVLLATGGLGHVYRETTNSAGATGDGVALSYRAGACLSDLEFIQFYPTVLYVKCAPRFLLSEALRSEGACLRNVDLQRFLPRYHEAGELAPRDVVARSIMAEMARTGSEFVYLDLTELDPDFVQKRFQHIYETCLNCNIDITTDLVPVRPAAHYAMGGVKTDVEGRTTLEALYAAGEVACTGVHGANRLASNSLLESLVFGARAGRTMAATYRPVKRRSKAAPAGAHSAHRRSQAVHSGGNTPRAEAEETKPCVELRDLAWRQVGIIREGKELAQAVEQLESLEAGCPAPHRRSDYELQNMLTVARLIAQCALAREESRGGHYRSDFPFRVDDKLQKHSTISRGAPVNFE